MSTTLPLFWHLSSSTKKERLDASVKLVEALQQFQTQFTVQQVEKSEETSDDEQDEATAPDGLDVLNAQDVAYSIRRLVRGLASPRESSRLGFAVALTELLSRLNTITCSQIISIIIDASSSQGSMTGQEERDVLFARLFGLTAVIQSGLLTRTTPLPTSAAAASTSMSFRDTLTHLIQLGEKKSWLRESAWWTILLAIIALHDSPKELVWKAEAVDAALDVLYGEKSNKEWSPEKIAVTLKLQALYPERAWQSLLAPSFKNPHLLSVGNLATIAKILKESAIEDDSDTKTTAPKIAPGSWKPQLHFVWDIILDQLLPGPNSPANLSKGSFQEFFRVVVDESLFSATSSPERKYWGFQVFQKALPRTDEAAMPLLFTKNFMRSWINHLSHTDRYLHKIAKQVAADIQSFVQSNPTLGFTLILQLTGGNGNRQFDKLTKTKTVESILGAMDAEGIKNYIAYLLELLNEKTDDPTFEKQVVNSRRTWIIEQLIALIRNGAIPKSDDWIQSILDWLIVHGLFIVRKKSHKSAYLGLQSLPSPAFSDELRQNCRSKLLMALADLTSQTTSVKSGEKTTKIPAVSSTGEFWVSRVLTTIETLEKDTKHVSLLDDDVDEEDQALRIKTREIILRLQSLQKAEAEQHQIEAARGVELLLSATLLQHYCSEEDSDASILETCLEGADRMFPVGKKSKTQKSSRKSETITEETDALPEPIDVLVDAIIGFLEKSTAYMRTVGNHVFSLISGLVKESTIELVLTQLETRDPAELMEEDEDEDDMEVDGEEAVEESSSDESDDRDMNNESDDEHEDLELRRKIEEALRVNGIKEAGDDSDDSDEDLMDDDQMMAIDEQLAAVFRARVAEKKSGKDVDAQREATHFKNRVLDLVDTFVKKQPNNSLIVRLILPLVDLIAATGSDERQLAEKATGILRSRIGKLKDVPTNVDLAEYAKIIEDLHLQARRAHSADALTTLSQCSLYVVKAMVNADNTAGSASVLGIYRLSLVDFLNRKNSSLNFSFFQDFIRRYPLLGWEIRKDLLELSATATNVYRRCQAFQLLQIIVTQSATLGNERKTDVLEFFTVLREALLELLSSATTDKVVLTTAQMKELLKLALLSTRQTKRVSSDDTERIWQPASWIALRTTLSSADRFKESTALQAMCQQMSQASTAATNGKVKKVKAAKDKSSIITDVVAPKRKAVDGDDAPLKKKRKNSKKDNTD